MDERVPIVCGLKTVSLKLDHLRSTEILTYLVMLNELLNYSSYNHSQDKSWQDFINVLCPFERL